MIESNRYKKFEGQCIICGLHFTNAQAANLHTDLTFHPVTSTVTFDLTSYVCDLLKIGQPSIERLK